MSPALALHKRDSGPPTAPKQRSGSLRIGSPSDALEREADQVAEAVMSNADAPNWSLHKVRFGEVQRKCSCQESGAGGECEECKKKKETLQRKPAGSAPSAAAPAIVDRVLESPGRPLDRATRGFFEPRFGNDFSRVRIHTDSHAADSARAVNALAYTVNDHIVFGSGRFDPSAQAGRQLLAHELAHVTQQQDGRSSLLRRQLGNQGPTEVDLAEPDECEGRADITQEFNDFVKGLPALLASAPDFTPEQRDSFKAEFDRFLQTEAGVNVKTFKVISCDKINSDLMVGGETALAEVDSGKKEIRLSKSTKQLIDDFKQTKDKALLGKLIETLAHEKRHATLGSALKVDPKNVLPGRPETVAKKAEYRAQEILTVAEEIAVGRRAFGKPFAVSESKQEKLRRQNNMIKNYVTPDEYKRLRTIIIAKLRERYGFDNGCDNALTLGVVSSMDHNRWFECVPGSATGIVPPVPSDLHICDDFCKTQLPRPANTENEEDVKVQRKAADSGTSTPAFAPAMVGSVLQSSGRPLDKATRAYFEPRFGADFSRVRVHTDAQAAESARGVNALAYTVGDRIAFAEGHYAPHTSDGRRLLAHELAHTVQQGQGRPVRVNRPAPSPAISQEAGRSVMRQENPDVAAKRNEFQEAVSAGDWERAAEILNGFNVDDIRAMLAKLSDMRAASIYLGATKNRAVGPQSNAANLTRASYLDLNFRENRQTGHWDEAAKYLNGFSKEDIASHLQTLRLDEKQSLLDGAKSSPEVGSASNVATLTAKALESQSNQAPGQQGASNAAADSPNAGKGDRAAQSQGEQFALDGRVVNSVGRAAFGDTAWPFLKAVFEGFVNGIKDDLKAGRGAEAKGHLKGLFKPWNAAKFYGGYVLGLVLGLISPITDLVQGIIGIIKLAGSALEWLAKWSPLGVAISPERQQKIVNLTRKFTELAVQFGAALAEFVKDPKGSAQKFSAFLDSMMKLALGKAREMGASAAHSIFDFLNEPYFEMGKSIGKVIGSLIAQVLLLVFSDAIGNLIKEAAGMLGKIADFVAGKAVELIEWMTAFIAKVIGKVRELINGGLNLFKGLFESLIDAFEALKGLFTESEELAAGLKTAPAGGGELGAVPKGTNVMESRMVTGTRTAPARVEDLTPPKIHPSKLGETAPPKTPATNTPPAKTPPPKTPPAKTPSARVGKAGDLPPAAQERGEDIVGIFEERQRGARASGDLQGDLRDELGDRRRPGGKDPPQAAVRGNFAHQYYEELETKLLPEAENLVSEKLPAGLEKEVEVPDKRLPQGKRPRMDRLDRANGVVIEIKPDSLREVGQVEAQGYAAEMDKFDPLPPPQKWKAKVVTYDAKKVTAFLKKIGYLK